MTQAVSAQQRYLALFLPFLATDRLRLSDRGHGGASADLPLILTEKLRGADRVAACNAPALAVGLVPGMALADARARVPDVRVAPHDPAADLALIERLADDLDRFTPMVALDPPDGLMLDMTGCVHLFGSEAALAAQVEARLTGFGLAVRHAFAATPEGARALARFQSVPAASEAAALRRLPVMALELEDEALHALRRAGLRTIGDLAGRPRAPLAARFGAGVTDRLDRLLGLADSRITPRRPPPALRFERRFAEPLGLAGSLMAVIAELAGEAAAALAERDRGGRCFVLRCYRCDGHVRSLMVDTSLPSRDPALVVRLLHERIDALADPLDPGFGFDMLALDIPRVEPLAPTQLALEGGAVREAELAGLIDRLAARHGRTRLRRLVPGDSHVPEQGVLSLPAADRPAPAPWAAPAPGEPPLRPLHLFDPPQPIEVVAAVPEGPPRRFRWKGNVHDVVRYDGPERIAPEWWRLAAGEGRTRDYFRIEDARGRRYWLFRHGLYGREAAAPRWFLHGLFA
ncbi:DNA polymerase Y family protein [Sphingomonas changnyeongensis]|uniref:DNA polymerase Y family protein n=1 Tax=Sphingomonas changnyeongensis TaxID=2698679 RepID=A0A7Z2NXA1_9SPHN|nr:DNA polymerase Y family protein [Sphingomonas changnyeongensis]QHL91217.1 DNA polymerase Y family protein [Sphingomonas changnyeongensis]